MESRRVVAVSGGFDPLHVGHARMMKAARRLGDELVVIVNNDHWLRDKKGYVFMPEAERVELIGQLPYVDRVVLTRHERNSIDRSVCDALSEIRPDVFANGGDRFADNIPEAILCRELGIELVFNVGEGGKVQSSSSMVDATLEQRRTFSRPWGTYQTHVWGEDWYVKTLHVSPKSQLSLQSHSRRDEHWLLVEGDAIATIGNDPSNLRTQPLREGELFTVPRGAVHRISSQRGAVIVEVMRGAYDETDIVRFEDDYGRA